jgi:hypothetical protein
MLSSCNPHRTENHGKVGILRTGSEYVVLRNDQPWQTIHGLITNILILPNNNFEFRVSPLQLELHHIYMLPEKIMLATLKGNASWATMLFCLLKEKLRKGSKLCTTQRNLWRTQIWNAIRKECV